MIDQMKRGEKTEHAQRREKTGIKASICACTHSKDKRENVTEE